MWGYQGLHEGVNDLESPNLILIMNRPNGQYNVSLLQEPLLYTCISFEGLSHLYLKYMGLRY
jgi:hypothetical protein